MLTVGSLFAGIGGIELGLERTGGFKTVWQVELDATANNVRSRHWPETPRYEDVTKFTLDSDPVRPDLICGGFPCQDLSVAGKRAGLAGSRSGLFHEFMRIVSERTPRWVLVENVPGLLSSNEGRDMGIVLTALAELGYGTAYRILDAQWFGVAQRRRRVFIVGCIGDDWRRAAKVLFESESLPWNPPPSRETGSRVAASLTRGTDSSGKGGYAGRRQEDDVNIVNCLDRHMGSGGPDDNVAQASHLVPTHDVAPCIQERDGKGPDSDCTKALVAYTLRSEGHDASEDGTGRGTSIVPVAFDTTQVTCDKNYSNPKPGDPCHPLAAGMHAPAVAFQPKASVSQSMNPSEPCPTIGTTKEPAVAYSIQERAVSENPENGPQGKGWQGDQAFTLEARSKVQAVSSAMRVRRLTPRECERLQGFPDDWTRYGADGKEISDSARYRMLGNAVAVPVAEWIGKRILEADE